MDRGNEWEGWRGCVSVLVWRVGEDYSAMGLVEPIGVEVGLIGALIVGLRGRVARGAGSSAKGSEVVVVPAAVVAVVDDGGRILFGNVS